MISVFIHASADPKPLVRVLTALVPAAADGLVREVSVLGAEGPAREVADDAGATLWDAGAFAAAAEAARGPWLAGVPLGVVFAADWAEVLSTHVNRDPAEAAQLVARGFSLGASPEGWLAPQRLASAGAVEQDLERLARRSGRRLRLFDRR